MGYLILKEEGVVIKFEEEILPSDTQREINRLFSRVDIVFSYSFTVAPFCTLQEM